MHEIGLTSVFFADPSVANWARAYACGVKNVEICFRDALRDEEMLRTGHLIYHHAREAGIRAASAHLPFLNAWDISSSNVAERRQAIRSQKKFLDTIGDLEIPLAVLHPSFEPIDESERAQRMARSTEAIAELGVYAKGRGVRLAVENLPRTCLGHCAEEMLTLTDHGRNAGICMDVNHLLLESHEHMIKLLGPYIIHLHVSDYDRKDEKHWLPGNGVMNWPELFSLLERAGYTGDYLVEIREYSAVAGQTVTPETVMNRLKTIMPQAGISHPFDSSI